MVIYGKPTKSSFGMSSHHSVFRNESVLVPEFVPLTTPHRGDQMKALEAYFQGVVERSGQMSQNVLLSGPVGSGKSMLAKKLGATLERNALLYGNRVKFFHVNCRIDRSLQAILTKCMHFLGHGYPSRGFGFEELLQSFSDALTGDKVHLIVAFDEVDSLVISDPSSLYTITRLREVSQGSQVFSSLLISKTLDYLKAVDLSTLELPPVELDIPRPVLVAAALRHPGLQEPGRVQRRLRRG